MKKNIALILTLICTFFLSQNLYAKEIVIELDSKEIAELTGSADHFFMNSIKVNLNTDLNILDIKVYDKNGEVDQSKTAKVDRETFKEDETYSIYATHLVGLYSNASYIFKVIVPESGSEKPMLAIDPISHL